MRRLKRRLILAFLLVAAIGLSAWRFYDPGWRYPIKGVDVSHHQGSVDWEALAGDDISFAYIKASEGGDWVDSRFSINWEQAETAGLLRGAYHFFTLCTEGREQAANMIATVPDAPGMLPPAVDLEYAGNCSGRPSSEEFTEELSAFLYTISEHYQMRPVIYTNAHFYREYLAEDPPDVTWWMQTPVVEPWGEPEWTIWQHIPGRVDGVNGDVDRNVFGGSRAELVALAERHSG